MFAADKSTIEAGVSALKTALQGEDAEGIKARTNDLMQAQMKLGEAMYKAQQAAGGAEAGAAGSGQANPMATILSAALMLDALEERAAAAAVTEAAESVIAAGPHTPDLGGTATTAQVANDARW